MTQRFKLVYYFKVIKFTVAYTVGTFNRACFNVLSKIVKKYVQN